MSILQRLGRPAAYPAPQRQQQGQGLLDPRAKFRELQQDPTATLSQAGLSVPQGSSDPHQMVDYLVQSGQISPALYNKVARFLGIPTINS